MLEADEQKLQWAPCDRTKGQALGRLEIKSSKGVRVPRNCYFLYILLIAVISKEVDHYQPPLYNQY